MGKTIFSSVITARWLVCVGLKTNQCMAVASEPFSRDFFFSATNSVLRWLFTDAGIRRWKASSSRIRTSRSNQLADSVIPWSHAVSIQKVWILSWLLQLLLLHPQKRRRPATYSRSQTPELSPDEKVIQNDHSETDPLANMSRGLVHVAGSERRVLSNPGSPPSQTINEIRIQRGGISTQGPAIWAVPGSPHFYTPAGLWCYT